MKEEITFLVQGSAADPYEVRFVNRGNGNLSAYCTCMAGQKGTFCKHRINILKGETRGIVESNLEDVKTVASWLPDTDIEIAIKNVEKAEDELDIAKSVLAKAKKRLSQALLD